MLAAVRLLLTAPALAVRWIAQRVRFSAVRFMSLYSPCALSGNQRAEQKKKKKYRSFVAVVSRQL